MKARHYIISALTAAACLLSSCEEWDQVFTGDYGEADEYEPVTMTVNTTIKELKSMYTNAPVKIETDIVIGGQVISEDRTGNIYRSLYIQDETGAIELKIGKSGLYNDYKLGQWVYVKCSGLTVGNYNGMIQLGYADPTGEYETSYIDVQYIIDTHIFRGEFGTPVEPKVVDLNSISDLTKSDYTGCYVTMNGFKYGNLEGNREIFCLIYVDPNKDKKANSNRIFLDDEDRNGWGVTTWAMSKNGYLKYLNAGNFDNAQVNDGSSKVSDPTTKATLVKNASAGTVSQYFNNGTKELQVRTSGYARFADTQIDDAILNGATVNFTGILTVYSGNAQFTLIDLEGVEIVE